MCDVKSPRNIRKLTLGRTKVRLLVEHQLQAAAGGGYTDHCGGGGGGWNPCEHNCHDGRETYACL